MSPRLDIARELTQLAAIHRTKVSHDEVLSRYTTLRIGGSCDAFVSVDNTDQLREALLLAKRNNVPIEIIGGGSNLLVKDEGYPGIVVKLGAVGFKSLEIEGNLLTSGAATLLRSLVKETLEAGLVGLERCAGIPGTFGGALSMNAGSAKEYIGDLVHSVRLMTWDGEEKELLRDEIEWSYRKSSLKAQGIVLEGTLELKEGKSEELIARVIAYLERRRHTQPLNFHNAGSIFKNPPGDSAGRLIESCGLKGFRIGDAQVSTLHANFIVNLENATATDYLAVIDHVKKEVLSVHGIELEQELKVLEAYERP